LATARADEKTAHSNLAAAAAGQDFAPWPGQLIALYLGGAAPQDVLWAARDPDPKQEKSQLCDAYFFLAEHALLGSDPGNAKGLFEQALETGMTDSTEYVAAGEELRQLTAQPKP
jgi:lipoprotein NlpI